MDVSTKAILVAAMLAALARPSAAQTSGDTAAATSAGRDLSVSVGHYNYIEPGTLRISIHGLKVGGDYTETLLFNRRAHWFAQANVRGRIGSTAYDGWCLPWLIRPSSSSPNGYALGLGTASTCSETGDADGYLEARGVIGKDWLSRKWGVAPQSGLGVRDLSNGISGVTNFRTDTYLYVPFRLTARRSTASPRTFSVTAEYDLLLRGWQTTRNSKLGGGLVSATPTAPAFAIDGFSDLSFDQHRGWAVRASAKYHLSRRWFVEPSYIYWHVSDSPVSVGDVQFTVNGIAARQQLGALEPVNATHEWSASLGMHF